MMKLFWCSAISLLISVHFCFGQITNKGITFNYNNNYKYNEPYTVEVSKSTEYILEFAGDIVAYDTPARVTVASDFANKTYPLFITARQQKGVFSWQLPMMVETPESSEKFTNISRTLCPHNNIFSQDEDTCDVSSLNIPIVHLTSSSPDPIKATISVETVRDFFIKQNTVTNVTCSPSQPRYYFYPFDQGPNREVDVEAQSMRRKRVCSKELDKTEQVKSERYSTKRDSDPSSGWWSDSESVIVMIESDDDICAVVSIQKFSCPVFDTERDILYDGYYLTMTRSGGITLTQDSFPYGFYIVFIVKSSDEACSGNSSAEETAAGLRGGGEDGRVKTFRLRVVPTISRAQYLQGAAVALSVFVSFYVACAAAAFCYRTGAPDRAGHCVRRSDGALLVPEVPHDNAVVPASRRRRVVNDASCSSAGDGPTVCSSSSDSELERSVADEDDEKDLRVDGRLCVAHLARSDPRVLSSRSRRYVWSVLTVAVFYTLPVLQLVLTYQKLVNQSGNQDLCYLNFLCAHPVASLADSNHVLSNAGYVLLGALFLVQVSRRQRRSRPTTEMGIPQHWGLLYALGVSLLSEGLLSAAYHVCPNSMNFQFDTSFMYVTSVLCMVKIYQSRHPDINARAHATFGVLALIIFIGLVGVLNANLYFWVLFTALHLVTCLVLTFHIYYLGRFKFAARSALRACASALRGPLPAPARLGRGVLLLLANLANWTIAAYGLCEHSRDFASHLLLVLMSNLFLYTLFYIVMKLLHRESIRWYSWVFIFLTYSTWFGSSYFYLDLNTNWALSPAQSRRHNRPCTVLELFDSHDMWHFLSSIAMFFSFNMYLTIDDNLDRVPRTEIMVF